MTKPQHTPLPYHAADIGGQGWTILTAENDIIAILGNDDLESGDCLKEDAAFIVRACNSYHGLLEALKIVQAIAKGDRKSIENMGFIFAENAQKLSDWATNKVNAAIAKAESK